jgi:predicted Fe-S protein YdhL (DUF1289 family)
MRCGRTLGAYALALLMGLAAPCVHAQRHGGGGAHMAAPRMSAPRQNYGHQAVKPRVPARAQQGGGRGSAANSYHPPASAPASGAANEQRPAENRPQNEQGSETNANQRSMSKLPQKWAENLRDRSPEEQERFMQNNERFKNLPPAQQAQIRQNLQKWNSLSPTEKNAIRDRQETWQRMSPEQRNYVQKSLLPKWQAMSPDRKQLVTGRLHTLQQMTPEQRAAALDDPRFMQGLSPDEQSVLRGLDSVRNPNP